MPWWKVTWEGKCLFGLCISITVIIGNSGQELKAQSRGRNWSTNHRGIPFNGLLFLTCYYVWFRTNFPCVSLPTVAWHILHQLEIKIKLVGLPRYNLMEAFSQLNSLFQYDSSLCQVDLKKKTYQNSIFWLEYTIVKLTRNKYISVDWHCMI